MPPNRYGYPKMPEKPISNLPGDKCEQYDMTDRPLNEVPRAEQGPPPRPLHHSTYEYLKPSDAQLHTMATLRDAARRYSDLLEALLPDGPDKTFVLRAHRQNAMWVNVAVTRLADGTPRP